MSKSRHPLSETFDIEGSPFSDDYDDEIIIPDDREEQNLALIIELALKQYSLNVSDMALIEPKNRIKVMEINEKLLNTAKDARYKLERIRIEQEKLRRTKTGPKNEESLEEDTESSEGISRNALMERAKNLRSVK